MTDELHKRATIFVVEDEPVNLALVESLLAGQGYGRIVPIQDSREVLRLYREARPDLIMLDIRMPHLDGYQVLEQLKALNDPLLPPILILSAYPDREHLLKTLASGARDFVAKPFDRIELLMRVRNLLDAHLAHRMVYDQKAVLEEMVRIRTKDLNDTRLQIVQRLGRAAEYRDNETGLHIIRMSQYSALLARSLGWSDESCELMLHASPMHDIGKIGIPDSILLKPGKLDDREWEIMKTHTTIGARILEDSDSNLLQMASEIALTHHEKWDGTGYPRGLLETAIPQSGCIVALTDVFDALTSVRSYKGAWPVDDAVDFIEKNAGTHFDPEIVENFIACLPEILAIRGRYLDPGEKA